MVSEREQDIRDVLGNAGQPLTHREVTLASGVARSTVRDVLRRMLDAGEIQQTGDGERYTMVNEGAAVETAEAGKRSQVGEHDQTVLAAVLAAGDFGLTITEVATQTGIRRRICENVLFRLEVRYGDLVSVGRPKRYRLKTEI